MLSPGGQNQRGGKLLSAGKSRARPLGQLEWALSDDVAL